MAGDRRGVMGRNLVGEQPWQTSSVTPGLARPASFTASGVVPKSCISAKARGSFGFYSMAMSMPGSWPQTVCRRAMVSSRIRPQSPRKL